LLSIRQIREQFPDQWVLVEVKRHVWRTGNLWGWVLANSTSHDDLIEPACEFRQARPGAMIGVEFTGPLLDPNADVVIAPFFAVISEELEPAEPLQG
jgi:hypothetical protein